ETRHRAVQTDVARPDVTQQRQEALRLAKGVAEEHGRALFRAIRLPPLEDFGDDDSRIVPRIDRQPERRFGDEGVAGYRLERQTCRIGCTLVVAGDNPHFPIAFDPDLRGSEDVTSGMKRDADVADRDRLTPRLGLDDAIRESVTEQ